MGNDKALKNKTKPKKEGEKTDETPKNKVSLLYLQLIATITLICVTIVGGYMFIDNRYAIKKEMKRVAIKLDILDINIKLKDIEERICYLKLKTKKDFDDKKQIMKLESQRGSFEKERELLYQSLLKE